MKHSNSASNKTGGISRRHFIAATGMAALSFPIFIPAKALGRDGNVAPSNKIIMGVTGWGMQGPGNTRNFMNLPDCQVVAACDLDSERLASAKKTIDEHYKNEDCKTYAHFEEMFARKDIDAVMLAVPDHWHALIATAAAKAKKHIYGEKPLARTIREQQAIVHAVERNKVQWQTGSWQRSEANFHKAAEIVRNGYIGKVSRVEVGLPAGHHDFGGTAQYMTATPPPPELDYERWIGPSRMEPYIRGRVHENWRWNYNTGGGQLLDWIGHHCDIAHWGLDFDRSGPSKIEGHGEFPPADAVWNTCTKYRIELEYPNDVHMTIAGGYPDIRSGVKWIGSDGWVYVDRGKFEGSKEEWSNYRTLPEDMRKVKIYHSTSHYQNLIDCIKSGEPTITPVQTAHHSAIPGHLGLISMLVERPLRWDVAKEKILDDHAASELLTRPYRKPYKMPPA